MDLQPHWIQVETENDMEVASFPINGDTLSTLLKENDNVYYAHHFPFFHLDLLNRDTVVFSSQDFGDVVLMHLSADDAGALNPDRFHLDCLIALPGAT